MLSRLTTILLLSLGLTTCLHLNGSGTIGSKDFKINTQHNQTVELFKMCGQDRYLERLSKTTVIFKDLGGSYGECQPYSNIVRIHQDTWYFLSPIEKLELYLHEVGHCVLLMEHRDNSIMRTTGFLSGDLYLNLEKYMNEYFQCNNCCNIPKDFL